jgi:hypothetical protein
MSSSVSDVFEFIIYEFPFMLLSRNAFDFAFNPPAPRTDVMVLRLDPLALPIALLNELLQDACLFYFLN